MSHTQWARARWRQAKRVGLSTVALTCCIGTGAWVPARAQPVAPPVTTSPVELTPSTTVPKAKKKKKKSAKRTVAKTKPRTRATTTAAAKRIRPPVPAGAEATSTVPTQPPVSAVVVAAADAPTPRPAPSALDGSSAAPAFTPLPAVSRGLDRGRLQAALETWARSQKEIRTITVAVRSGDVTWTGSATADGTAAPDPSRVYRAMSVTKTVTATLVLRAVAEGKLTLDEPLPPLAGVDAPVPAGLTVRMLLRHRSGFVDYTAAPGYRADEAMSPQKAVELTLRAGVAAPPDTVTRYVNSNYLYLGLLLEQVEQRPYAELVAELLDPLGLPHTRVDPPDRSGWAGYSSGGIMSNAAELAAWGAALFTPGKVMSSTNLALMTSFNEANTGLGLWALCPCTPGASLQRFSVLGHQTAAGGMFVFPDDGTIIVMRAEPEVGDTAVRAVQLGNALRAALAPVAD